MGRSKQIFPTKTARSSAGFGGLDSFFKESEEQRERIRRNKRRNRNKDVVDDIDTHDKDKRKRSKADRRAAKGRPQTYAELADAAGIDTDPANWASKPTEEQVQPKKTRTNWSKDPRMKDAVEEWDSLPWDTKNVLKKQHPSFGLVSMVSFAKKKGNNKHGENPIIEDIRYTNRNDIATAD